MWKPDRDVVDVKACGPRCVPVRCVVDVKA
jgi:hypothetical protein